mgnify:CR=1 FL=1
MARSLLANNARFRRSFEKIEKAIDVHNLIEIQKKSYGDFLQADVDPGTRENRGLQAVFNSVFPIEDFNQTASLQFVSYELEPPKYDEVLGLGEQGYRTVVAAAVGYRSPEDKYASLPKVRFDASEVITRIE